MTDFTVVPDSTTDIIWHHFNKLIKHYVVVLCFFITFIVNENYKNSTCHFALVAPKRINDWTSSFYLYIYAQFAQKIITDTQRTFTLDRRNTFHDVECKMEEKIKKNSYGRRLETGHIKLVDEFSVTSFNHFKAETLYSLSKVKSK